MSSVFAATWSRTLAKASFARVLSRSIRRCAHRERLGQRAQPLRAKAERQQVDIPA
jgi:hypothetical protein